VALIAALFFSLTVMALVSSTILSGVAVVNQSRYQRAKQEAQLAAESAVHLVIAELSGPNRFDLLVAGETEGVVRGAGKHTARYRVRIERASEDGVDNDQDLLVDEPDEADMLELTSIGSYDRVTRTVRVTLAARYEVPSIPAAVYLDDALAHVKFNGTDFTISGYDVDDEGNLTGLAEPGIAVNGPIGTLLGQINGKEAMKVTGEGGTPSVSTIDPIDLQELINEGARSANVILAGGGTYKPRAPGAWGTAAAPAIVYGQGDIHISDGSGGAGVMLVNGNLTITGGFDWDGIIIVGGEVVFTGGGNGKRLIGSLIVNSDLTSRGGSTDSGMVVGGTVDIQLSMTNVRTVARAFADYTIMNWREGPVPLDEALP
jgi:hypothetical protein